MRIHTQLLLKDLPRCLSNQQPPQLEEGDQASFLNDIQPCHQVVLVLVIWIAVTVTVKRTFAFKCDNEITQ